MKHLTLTSTCRQDPSLVAQAPTIASEVELALSSFCGPKEYAAKARSLLFNLIKNDELRKIVLLRQLDADKLVQADTRSLAPEKLKNQRAASKDAYYALRQVRALCIYTKNTHIYIFIYIYIQTDR